MAYLCTLETLCLGERNERRLTVGALAHLKAVERGPIPFASGTYIARRSLFSSWAGTAQPFRICRYMLSISMNYFIAGSTSH